MLNKNVDHSEDWSKKNYFDLPGVGAVDVPGGEDPRPNLEKMSFVYQIVLNLLFF